MPNTTIVEQLRRDRRELHLTIREVADLTNTSESTAKKVFSSASAQSFNAATLQPYVDLFASMKEKLPDMVPEEAADVAQAELSIVLLRLYREKSEELEALRADAELRDRRHARINLIQSIIIALLMTFVLFWLVYDVIYLDRGWIRAAFQSAKTAVDIIQSCV